MIIYISMFSFKCVAFVEGAFKVGKFVAARTSDVSISISTLDMCQTPQQTAEMTASHWVIQNGGRWCQVNPLPVVLSQGPISLLRLLISTFPPFAFRFHFALRPLPICCSGTFLLPSATEEFQQNIHLEIKYQVHSD